MIHDILMRLSLLHKEIPEEEFEVDLALETAIEDVDREVTAEERETLDELLPEWLDDGDDAAQKELVTDGGTQRTGDYRTEVEELLNDVHADRVFSVEEDVVWVSGMNAGSPRVARKMARTLVKHDIPAGLVYDDDAVQHGGVQFNYGDAA